MYCGHPFGPDGLVLMGQNMHSEEDCLLTFLLKLQPFIASLCTPVCTVLTSLSSLHSTRHRTELSQQSAAVEVTTSLSVLWPFVQRASDERKEETTPFGVNLTRSLVIYQAAQKEGVK